MSRISKRDIQSFRLWDTKARQAHPLFSFDLELTARCNLDCRHCYINRPAGDRRAAAAELTLAEIEGIAAQAVDRGALWCLLTGGEPLLRDDFPAVYEMLKRKGLLVSVFTNATLIRAPHVKLFKAFPPRDIEVTIYGSRAETFEAVTRTPGGFGAFTRGLELLREAGVRVRLKAVAVRSNIDDFEAIASFGRRYTKDFYRFDPVLHLRYDRDERRNAEIRAERLTPEEIVRLERGDRARFESLRRNCDLLVGENSGRRDDDRLFYCGAGVGSFSVGFDGTFRLCSSLWADGTTADLRRVSLKDACETLVPQVRERRVRDRMNRETCHGCPIVNLCLSCPAHADLETGSMEDRPDYFCRVAHARAGLFRNDGGPGPGAES